MKGRRPRTVEYSQARDVLTRSARDAANYLAGCFTSVAQAKGKARFEVSHPSPARIKAAMYCLDQVLGKPTFRVEGLDGATVTYNQIIIGARERARELAGSPASVALVPFMGELTEEDSDDGDSGTSEVLAAGGLPGDEDQEEGEREAGV